MSDGLQNVLLNLILQINLTGMAITQHTIKKWPFIAYDSEYLIPIEKYQLRYILIQLVENFTVLQSIQ